MRNPADRGSEDATQTLAELRVALGVTQAQLAERLGTTQPAVLKAERSPDPQLSSVRRYIAALGNQLEVSAEVAIEAVIDGTPYPLSIPQEEPMQNALLDRLRLNRDESHDPAPSDTHENLETAWRLRAWDDPFLEQRFLDEHVIAISNDELDSLETWPGEHELGERLRRHFTERSPQAIGTFVRYWHSFRIAMQIGDIVAVPISGRRAVIGEVVGDYLYAADDPDTKMRHRRAVRWLKILSRDELDDDLRKVLNAPGTICRFGATDAARRLRARAQQ